MHLSLLDSVFCDIWQLHFSLFQWWRFSKTIEIREISQFSFWLRRPPEYYNLRWFPILFTLWWHFEDKKSWTIRIDLIVASCCLWLFVVARRSQFLARLSVACSSSELETGVSGENMGREPCLSREYGAGRRSPRKYGAGGRKVGENLEPAFSSLPPMWPGIICKRGDQWNIQTVASQPVTRNAPNVGFRMDPWSGFNRIAQDQKVFCL